LINFFSLDLQLNMSEIEVHLSHVFSACKIFNPQNYMKYSGVMCKIHAFIDVVIRNHRQEGCDHPELCESIIKSGIIKIKVSKRLVAAHKWPITEQTIISCYKSYNTLIGNCIYTTVIYIMENPDVKLNKYINVDEIDTEILYRSHALDMLNAYSYQLEHQIDTNDEITRYKTNRTIIIDKMNNNIDSIIANNLWLIDINSIINQLIPGESVKARSDHPTEAPLDLFTETPVCRPTEVDKSAAIPRSKRIKSVKKRTIGVSDIKPIAPKNVTEYTEIIVEYLKITQRSSMRISNRITK
jgi:hypothetical protein